MGQIARYQPIFALFITTILFGQPFSDELKKMHALTVRKLEVLPKGSRLQSIGELVKTIHEHDTVPHQTILHATNNLLEVRQGIDLTLRDDLVFIFSRGYAKTTEPGTNDNFIQRGAAAKAAHIQFEDRIVPSDYPLISFDYDDGRYGFAFGQAGEINTLKTVYQAVLWCNPQARIVIVGDCRGAKVALEFATQRPKNIVGMILMAPFISGKELTDNIARANLSFPFRRYVLHNFFRIYFKHYYPQHDTLSHRLHLIDPNLPIFIGHRRYDQLVSMSTINRLVKSLRQAGNKNIEVAITNDIKEPHSKLTAVSEIQRKIAQFIDQHVISNNERN